MTKRRVSPHDIRRGHRWEFTRKPTDDIEVGIVQGKFKVQDEGYMINMRDKDDKSLGNVPLRGMLRRVRTKQEQRPEDSDLLK